MLDLQDLLRKFLQKQKLRIHSYCFLLAEDIPESPNHSNSSPSSSVVVVVVVVVVVTLVVFVIVVVMVVVVVVVLVVLLVVVLGSIVDERYAFEV